MKMLSSNEIYVRDIFARIGISLTKEGERRFPGDIVVRDDSLYYRLIARGSPVFVEGHMYKQWDCEQCTPVLRIEVTNRRNLFPLRHCEPTLGRRGNLMRLPRRPSASSQRQKAGSFLGGSVHNVRRASNNADRHSRTGKELFLDGNCSLS